MSHWSFADKFTVVCAVLVVLLALIRPSNRNTAAIGKCFGQGVALGPLLLILLSPFQEMFGLPGPNLLEAVVNENRIVLFVVAGTSILTIVQDLSN